MDLEIRQLLKKLSLLGYRGFEIARMVKEAIGHEELDIGNQHQCVAAVVVLKKYERLGYSYQQLYSK